MGNNHHTLTIQKDKDNVTGHIPTFKDILETLEDDKVSGMKRPLCTLIQTLHLITKKAEHKGNNLLKLKTEIPKLPAIGNAEWTRTFFTLLFHIGNKGNGFSDSNSQTQTSTGNCRECNSTAETAFFSTHIAHPPGIHFPLFSSSFC